MTEEARKYEIESPAKLTKASSNSEFTSVEIMQMIDAVGNLISSGTKTQAETNLATQRMNLEHELKVRQSYKPFAYLALLSFIGLTGYVLVINEDQTTALTVAGYAATFVLAWISGYERGKGKS